MNGKSGRWRGGGGGNGGASVVDRRGHRQCGWRPFGPATCATTRVRSRGGGLMAQGLVRGIGRARDILGGGSRQGQASAGARSFMGDTTSWIVAQQPWR